MIDVLVEDDRWNSCDIDALALLSAGAVLSRFGIDPENAELSLLACDDARIAGLNADFRGKPRPTNVLSWPAADLSPAQPGGLPRKPEPDVTGALVLGDIALAYETCANEAAAAGKPLEEHVLHLIVHGILHVLGFDHIDDADAARMQSAEVSILAGLGRENPYIVPDRA